jgi:acid phosphatase (class A)
MTSKQLRTPLIVLFAAIALAASPTTKHGSKYLAPASIDFKAILSNPPANDSAQTRAELEEILSMQASRTPEQVARVQAESTLTLAAFTSVIGPAFDSKPHPLTDALLSQVELETGPIVDEAKKHWDRTRPYVLAPAVKPAIDKPSNGSYPSGHATRAFTWAIALQQLFPEKKTELLARAEEIGVDRIIAGVHYRSDVTAGKKLGEAIAAKILKSKVFQADLAGARKELNAKK